MYNTTETTEKFQCKGYFLKNPELRDDKARDQFIRHLAREICLRHDLANKILADQTIISLIINRRVGLAEFINELFSRYKLIHENMFIDDNSIDDDAKIQKQKELIGGIINNSYQELRYDDEWAIERLDDEVIVAIQNLLTEGFINDDFHQNLNKRIADKILSDNNRAISKAMEADNYSFMRMFLINTLNNESFGHYEKIDDLRDAANNLLAKLKKNDEYFRNLINNNQEKPITRQTQQVKQVQINNVEIKKSNVPAPPVMPAPVQQQQSAQPVQQQNKPVTYATNVIGGEFEPDPLEEMDKTKKQQSMQNNSAKSIVNSQPKYVRVVNNAEYKIFGQKKNPNSRYDPKTRCDGDTLFYVDTSQKEYIKPGLKLGHVGMSYAAGGTGKSFKNLQDAVLLAFTQEYGKTRGVLYLAAEDDMEEIADRYRSILTAYGIPEEIRKSYRLNFQAWSLMSDSPDLFEKERDENGKLLDTNPLIREIYNIATSYERDPLQYIIFDTVRQFHNEDENDNTAANKIISVLKTICGELNCSAIFTHHVSKMAALNHMVDAQQAARGAGGYSDYVRYAEFLYTMPKEVSKTLGEVTYDTNGNRIEPTEAIGLDNRGFYVRWGVSKQNYGSPIPEKWLKKNMNGVLLDVELAEVQKDEENGNGGKKGRKGNYNGCSDYDK